MGKIENEQKLRVRRGTLVRGVVGVLLTTGVVTTALVAPKMLSLIRHLDPRWAIKLAPEQRIRLVYGSLKKRGLITYTKSNGRTVLTLTEKGKHYAERERLKMMTQQIKRWDRRWRVLIFDLPERERHIRDHLRHELNEIGFRQLQKSVWIYPYPCDDYILLIKKELGAGRRARYMIVESLEGDDDLKKFYNLA